MLLLLAPGAGERCLSGVGARLLPLLLQPLLQPGRAPIGEVLRERACGFVGPGEGELDSLAGPAVGEPRGQAEEGRSGCSGDSHLNEPVEARRLMSRGGGGDDVPKERG
jgi:hypothetical protein